MRNGFGATAQELKVTKAPKKWPPAPPPSPVPA
jgi:hypothetical protein